MSKKTIALVLGLIILAVVLLVIAVRPILTPTSTDTPQDSNQAATTPTPPEAGTTLMLSPNPLTLTAAETGRVEVIVDSSFNNLTAVQLEMSYDPEIITNVQVQPGPFFPKPLTLLNSVDTVNGRITYALGITPAQTPVQGDGVVAEITFNIIPGNANKETTIELLPKSLVTQQGAGQSVLMSMDGATIIIPPAQTNTVPTTALSPIPTNSEQQ